MPPPGACRLWLLTSSSPAVCSVFPVTGLVQDGFTGRLYVVSTTFTSVCRAWLSIRSLATVGARFAVESWPIPSSRSGPEETIRNLL